MATASGPEFPSRAQSVSDSSLPFGAGTLPTLVRLRLLWQKRRAIFRCATWGMVLSGAIAVLIPARYQSTTQLMPPDEQVGGGLAMAAALANKMDGSLAGLAGNALGLKSSGDLFIGVLQSRTVEDDLIGKFDLRKVYGEHLWQNARNRLAANTSISEDRKSGIIGITVTDRSPVRASQMAQEYVTELNSVIGELATSSAHRERVFLEGRLAQVKQELETAEKDFSEFASRNATVDLKEQGRAMVEGAANLEGQLIAAQSELEGLKQIYAENNVRVRSLRARIAELQAELERLGGVAKDVAGSEDADRQNPYPSLRRLPLLGVTYADLYRRSKVEEAVFETLTQEYELAKVAEAKEIPTLKVLDSAEVPERKSFPPRLMIMLLGIFLSSGCSFLWILVRACWDEISAADPHKILVQEILSTVNGKMPWASPNGSSWQVIAHQAWIKLVSARSAIENPARAISAGDHLN